MTAYFDRFTIDLTFAQADLMSRPGQDATEEVQYHLSLPQIKRQFRKINPDAIRQELKEYGAWNTGELADDTRNQERILWIAAGNIKEEAYEKRRR